MEEFSPLTYRRHPLDVIFAPRTVAVIGATEKEGSVGRTLLWNLISNPFGGTIYPVNPKAQQRPGHSCLPLSGRNPRQN
jgi:acetyltransferase